MLHFLLLFVVAFPHSVSGHAYVYWPASRNFLLAPHISHCFNVAGPPVAYETVHNAGGKAQPGDFAKGLCGNFGEYGPTDNLANDGIANGGGEPVATYQEGTSITFTIVNNAEHGGHYEFRLCDRKIDASMGSREEAAQCLDANFLGRYCVPQCGCNSDSCRENPENNDPNDSSFYAEMGPPPSLQQGGHKLTVSLPAGLTCEHCTIQWFWHTTWNEQFWNCIDIKIEGSGGDGGSTAPPQVSTTFPVSTTTYGGGGGVGNGPCMWTTPLGRQVTTRKQSEKPGRICWEFTVPQGTTVHYQAEVDIYHFWNIEKACCLAERSAVGSNVVTFTPTWTSFGFCECIGWTSGAGGTTCAGQATAENMICPVEGEGGRGMCPDNSALSLQPAECGVGPTPAPPVPPSPGGPTPAPSPPSCGNDWDSCLSSRCCASAGFTCFEKDATYAECRSDPCPDSWNCNVPTPGPLPAPSCASFCSLTAVSSCKVHQSEEDCMGHYLKIGAHTMPCAWSGCSCNADGDRLLTCHGLDDACTNGCWRQLCGRTELVGETCADYSYSRELCNQKYFSKNGASVSCQWTGCGCFADGATVVQCPNRSQYCPAVL
jgi:hypothetical protein